MLERRQIATRIKAIREPRLLAKTMMSASKQLRVIFNSIKNFEFLCQRIEEIMIIKIQVKNSVQNPDKNNFKSEFQKKKFSKYELREKKCFRNSDLKKKSLIFRILIKNFISKILFRKDFLNPDFQKKKKC